MTQWNQQENHRIQKQHGESNEFKEHFCYSPDKGDEVPPQSSSSHPLAEIIRILEHAATFAVITSSFRSHEVQLLALARLDVLSDISIEK